jgi:hypothetical protein
MLSNDIDAIEWDKWSQRRGGYMSSPQKPDLKEQQLGCYRLWVRPKTSEKKAKKRGHSILGPYFSNAKR